MNGNELKVKKLNVLAQLPFRATSGSVGYDLYSVTDVEMAAYEMMKVETGICVEIPEGFFGQICGRSSLALKKIDVLGGVIDNDYRGEIFVTLMNLSDSIVKLNKGVRICQMICIPYKSFDVLEVTEVSKTERGERGFGSSGNS